MIEVQLWGIFLLIGCSVFLGRWLFHPIGKSPSIDHPNEQPCEKNNLSRSKRY